MTPRSTLPSTAAAMLAAAAFLAPASQAEETAEEPGRLVRVGPGSVEVEIPAERPGAARRAERRATRQARRGGEVAVARYWIGVALTSVPDSLRAHIDVPEGAGAMVREVTPDSPAEEAGVLAFDLVLSADNTPVDAEGLADAVGRAGEAGESLALEVLRRGERVVLTVKPVERPIGADPFAGGLGGRVPREGLGGFPIPQGLLEGEGPLGEGLFGQGGFDVEGLAERAFGEGGFAQGLPQMAMGGLSVRITEQAGGPALVTVQRGEERWEFEQGDEDAMAALPDDVRPMVRRMIAGARPGFDAFGVDGGAFQLQFGGPLGQRVQALQERLRGMQGGFLGGGGPAVPPGGILDGPPAPAFAEQLEEAPPFDPGVGPVEIEVPEEMPAPAEGESGDPIEEIEPLITE